MKGIVRNPYTKSKVVKEYGSSLRVKKVKKQKEQPPEAAAPAPVDEDLRGAELQDAPGNFTGDIAY